VATLQLVSDFTGRTIGNFFIEEKIGDGGYGTVYRARHLTLDDRIVAIKVLKQEASHDPTLILRFTNEARAAAKVKHPGIVQIADIGEDKGTGTQKGTGTHYIVMEYLRGMDLQRWLAPHSEGLPLAEVLALLYDVADALDAVHDLGIIHRDLKPENLFRQEDGLVKILDLGIAKLTPDLAGSFRTATNILIGSPGYFAPELADLKRSVPIDRRSDVFSLAAVAYELLTHDKAWKFNDPWHYVAVVLKADEQRPRDIRKYRPEVPIAWCRAIMAGLAKDPGERPPSAGALVAMLADGFPLGHQIVAQRKDAIRAAQGLPPLSRASTAPPEAVESPTTLPPPQVADPLTSVLLPAAEPLAEEAHSATAQVEAAASTDETLRVQAPPPPSDDPSRVPTLVPERVATLVERFADRVPTLVPERVPTLVAPMPLLPTGPIPEPVTDAEPETGQTSTVHEEPRPAAIVASGTVASSVAAEASGRIESKSILLDPTFATTETNPQPAELEARPAELGAPPPPTELVSAPPPPGLGATSEPATTPQRRRSTRRRSVTVVAFATIAGAAILVLARSASQSSDSSVATSAPVAIVDATPTTLVDAAIGAAATPDVDQAVSLIAITIDASATDAAEPPQPGPPEPSQPVVLNAGRVEAGKVEVFANELTDVFLVVGSRPKFLGTTPLPRASVPAGTITLELRSRGRKATRKVTVRAGRKTRVEYTWSN